MRLAWFFLALGSTALLAVAHTVASAEYLYWQYRWLDTPMHLLGGFALGSLVIALLFRYRPAYYVAAMLFVAISWEVFEVALGLPQPADYLLDTAHDLLNDTLGAGAAFILARLTIWRSA
jgi:hypothetical protein